MPDFFISYTSSDEAWAEWIAWSIEESGLETVLQKWDFVAGSNFAVEMHRAIEGSARTIVVLSPDFMRSQFTSAEWTSVFATDPEGVKRALVPVKVRDCEPKGLLKAMVFIDLVGLDEEQAISKLLDGISPDRRKPSAKPTFPGQASAARKLRDFPGPVPEPVRAWGYMPRLRTVATDVEKRRFLKKAYATVLAKFEESLRRLEAENQSIEVAVEPIDASQFTAEIFVHGQSRTACKIRLGGHTGEGIVYSEGRLAHLHGNSINEMLTLCDHPGELSLKAMNTGFRREEAGLNPDALTADDAAEFLWRRFSSALERS